MRLSSLELETTPLCSDAFQILDSHSPGSGRGFLVCSSFVPSPRCWPPLCRGYYHARSPPPTGRLREGAGGCIAAAATKSAKKYRDFPFAFAHVGNF